jgi:serine/threonine-protein kinase
MKSVASSKAPERSSAPPSGGPPTVFAGRYEIEGRLGTFSIGTVYRAKDRVRGEVVALKVLRKDLGRSTLVVSRFERDAKLARRVQSPNVARVYDIGEHEGEHYLTTELVEGETLAERLGPGKPLGVTRAVTVGAQLARALAAAHEAGIPWCDLSPGNVVVEMTGRVVLRDVGASRDRPPDDSQESDLAALGDLLRELVGMRAARKGSKVGGIARISLPPRTTRPSRASVAPKGSDVPEALARLLADLEGKIRADAQEIAARLEEIASALVDRPSARQLVDAPRASVPTPLPAAPLPATPIRRAAMLPLANHGGQATRYVVEALSVDLIDRLASDETLQVVPRAEVEAAARGNDGAREIAKRLGVDAVIEGALHVLPSAGVRVMARLLDTRGEMLAEVEVDRPESAILEVGDELVQRISAVLRERSAAGPDDPVSRALRAYATYSPKGALEAEALLTEAFVRAPNDAVVASLLALAKLRRWGFEPDFGQGDEAAPVVAERLARGALKKAPSTGEAHLALAMLAHLGGDELGAMRSAREAVRCTPALAEAHRLSGLLACEAGATTLGERDLETALRLAPKQVLTLVHLARARALDRDRARAFELLDRADAESPDNLAVVVTRVQAATWCADPGDLKHERTRAIVDAHTATGAFAHAARAIAQHDEDVGIGQLVALAGTKGTTTRMRTWIMKAVAEARALSGDAPSAISALQTAASSGMIDASWLDRCPSLDPLRKLSGFADVRATVQRRASAVAAVRRA